MKTSISYKQVEPSPLLESAIERHLRKVGTLLKTYEPDLIQLHGSFEKQPHPAEYRFSVNLSLPTGALHATGAGPDAGISVRIAFRELEAQIKKHQALLRKDYEWRRKRGRVARAPA
jgi:ribosome-associated translation inhibitor RaiA